MACRTALRCAFMTEPWISSRAFCCSRPSSSRTVVGFSNRRTGFCDIRRRRSSSSIKARNFHSPPRPTHLSCSYNTSSVEEEEEEEQAPPQEAILKAISEVSKTEGRIGQTTNVIIGGTVTDDATNEWVALDQKVNSYSTVRGFTAIGTGGDDFVQAMIVAVESVIQQPILEGQVKQKVSTRGKYVSVNIGPVQVDSSEQVQAVYNAMRRDDRMKYFL